jgi:two-component system, OmpR family, response regulator
MVLPVNLLLIDPSPSDSVLLPLVDAFRARGDAIEDVPPNDVLARLSMPRFQAALAPQDLTDPEIGIVIERLRRSGKLVPFVVGIDARGARAESRFLGEGADLVVRVDEPLLSVARVDALVRRSTLPAALRRIDVGGMVIDEGAHGVEMDDGLVELAPSELRVLAALATRLGAIVGRAELVSATWGDCAEVSDNALESVIKRLRKRLGEQGGRIHSVRLRGYVLAAPAP